MSWFSDLVGGKKEPEPIKSASEHMEDLIKDLNHGGATDEIREIVKNPQTSSEVVDRVLSDKTLSANLRQWAASNPNASPDVLADVVKDRTDDRHVRCYAGDNPSVPVEALASAFRDPAAWENEDQALGELAKNRRVPVDALSEMILAHPPIREPGNLFPVERALCNPGLPAETLHEVLERKIEYREPDHPGPINNSYTALGAALRNPNTPVEDVRQVLFDKDEPDVRLRLAAMESKNITPQEVIAVLNDPTEQLAVNQGAYNILIKEFRFTADTDPNKAEIKKALVENYTDTRGHFPPEMKDIERAGVRFQANKHADSVLGITPKVEVEAQSQKV